MQELQPDRELDIRGEVCPNTFVWTKLELEEMEIGQLLRIVVNYFPATTNVPRSLLLEGHKVLQVSQIDDSDWQILVRKGKKPGS